MSENKVKSPLMSVLTNSAFWLALVINILSGMSRSMVKQPVTLLGSDLGLAASALGFITSAYTVCALLIRTPFGKAIDNSRKPAMILFCSNLFMAVVFAGFGICNSIPLFILLRLLHGFCFGMANMAMAVVLSKNVDKRALGSAFGLYTLLPKLTNAATNKVTLYLKEAAGVQYCAYVGAAIAVLCGLLCLMIKFNEGEQVNASKNRKSGLGGAIYTKALPICIIFALLQVPSLASNEFVVLFGKSVDMTSTAATYLANNGIFMGIGALAFGYMLDKLDIRGGRYLTLAVIAIAAAASAMIGLSLNPSIWLISGCMCGIGAGGANLIRSLSLRESSSSVAALAVGTFAAVQDLTSICCSTVIGLIVDMVGYQKAFLLLTIAPVVGFVLTILFFDRFIAIMSRSKEEAAA